MSVRVLSLVFDGYPGGGSDLLALLALADWSDDGGRCYPSITAIARKTRLSRSQAQRVVHKLISDGFLVVTANALGGSPMQTRNYRIVLDRLTGSACATPTGRTDATGSMHATGRTGAQEGSHPCGERGRTHATQTVSEPSTTVSKPSSIEEGCRQPTADGKKTGQQRSEPCPYQDIVAAYHERFPSGPRVTVLNEKRKRTIAARWREVQQGQYRTAGQPLTPRDHHKALRFFARYFEYCEGLDWCTGRQPMGNGGRYWRATIDNLMGADFIAKRSDEAHDERGPA